MSRKKLHVKRKATYRIRCADGCVMPLHRSIRVVDGVRPSVFTPETVITVAHHPDVVRRIMSGDFVEVDEPVHEDLIEPVTRPGKKKKES